MRLLTIITFSCLMLTMTALGQDLQHKNIVPTNKITGFAGPTVSIGKMNNQLAILWGARGAFFLDKQLFFGGYGTGLSNRIEKNITGNTGSTEKGTTFIGHGGLWMGYVFFPEKTIHFNTNMQLGWGGVSLHELGTGKRRAYNEIFALVPQLELTIQMPRWLKFSSSIGYSWIHKTKGINNPNLNAKEFRTPIGTFSILIGDFQKSPIVKEKALVGHIPF